METIEAIYENGQVQFTSPKLPKRKYKVLVTFLEEIETPVKNEISMDEFIDEWRGVLKGVKIDNYKDEKMKYLEKKYLK